MSLLDENFDFDIKQLIQQKFINIFNNQTGWLNLYFCKNYVRKLFPITDLNNCEVIIDDFDTSNDNVYYIGYDYLKTNDIHRIKIKLFNPKYVVPTARETREFLYKYNYWGKCNENVYTIKSKAVILGYNICYNHDLYISGDWDQWAKINIGELIAGKYDE